MRRDARLRFFETDASRWELTMVRVVLALVLFPHGAQKAFGWFGGFGFSATQGYFVDTLDLPWLLGAAVIAIELVGPVLLLSGFATRGVGGAVIAVMIGAVTVGGHLDHGFFMNWFGQQSGEGFEFHLLAIAMSAALSLAGGGAMSVDAWLTERATPLPKAALDRAA
jgi:putative oxidoreductase